MSIYSAAVIALGPLFYYRLDETSGTVATDSSGNGRTGTYTATGVTYSQPTLLASDADTAVAFNGSTGWVSVANSLITDTFTLEAWIKPASTAVQGCIIGGNTGSGALYMRSGGGLLGNSGGAGNICGSGAATFTAGTVHHCVYTKNGAANHLYLDGVDVTGAVTNLTCSSPGTTTVGAVLGGSFDQFNGTVDEAAIYGFALSAAQVAANYTNGITVPVGPLPTVPPVTVSVAFANNPLTPLASLTWTDITRYCQTITTTSGRQVETAQVTPGTLTVRLWNADARFNPFNTSSPHYGPFTDGTDTGVLGLVPGKRIRVTATWAGTTYNVFHGFIDAWPLTWPTENTAYVDVTATDGFKMLNLRTLGSVYAETIILDKPLAWYRLGDGSLTNSATSTVPLRTTGATAPYPVPVPAGVTFGGPALLTQDSTTSATFDGNFGSSISLGRYPLQTAVTSYCTEMWVQTVQTSGVVGLVCQGGAGVDRWGITFDTATSTLRMTVGSTGATDTVSVTAPSFNNGRPHYIAASHDTLNVLNALQFDSTRTTAAITVNTGRVESDLWIGGGGSGAIGATVNLAGQIQDVALYPGALTAAQLLNHYNAGNNALGNEASGARINRILNYVGWPAADRAIDTGMSLLQGSRQLQPALAELLATVASEGAGLCFMSPDGKVTFYDRRHTLTNAASLASQVTLGEGGEPYELANTTVALDDLDVWNDIQVTRQGGVTNFAESAVSQARYGQRTMAVTGLMVASDAQAADLASYWLSRYAAPLTRVRAVNVHPLDDGHILYPQVLGRVLLDQVTVTRAAPGGGAVFSQPSLIERIAHTIDPIGDWHTTWGLSVADTTRYWVLQDATYGVLQSTTRLYF